MTAILPHTIEEAEIMMGVQALHDLLPGRSDSYLHGLVETVLDAVTHHERCTSISPFTRAQCTKDEHKGPRHINGMSEWIDGSAVLGGRKTD